MFRNILSIFLVILATNVFSAEKNLNAHEHGSVKLAIAVEGNTVDFELDGPTESFISFEYIPKTKKEIEQFQNAKNLWTKNFFELISFDKNLNCKIANASFDQVIDEKETKEEQAKIKDLNKKAQGVHSDISAKAKVICQKIAYGTEINIKLNDKYKNIKKLLAEILSKDTRSVVIKSSGQSIKL